MIIIVWSKSVDKSNTNYYDVVIKWVNIITLIVVLPFNIIIIISNYYTKHCYLPNPKKEAGGRDKEATHSILLLLLSLCYYTSSTEYLPSTYYCCYYYTNCQKKLYNKKPYTEKRDYSAFSNNSGITI